MNVTEGWWIAMNDSQNGIEVPSRRDIEDLALRDLTLRHCFDVRTASKMLTYKEVLRMAVVALAEEKRQWYDRCLELYHKRAR